MAEAKEDQKKSKDRSPNYPGIDLASALEKAAILREREGKHFAYVETVFGHWGYAIKSSGGRTALSALKKFGLIDENKTARLAPDGELTRQIKLSDLALRILLDNDEESPERIQALQEAALNPSIHRKLWDRYY